MADRALSADLGFGFGKAQTDITEGAVGIVGQAFDNHHAVAGAVALVAGELEVFACAALGFFYRLVDNMGWNLVFFRTVNKAAKRKVAGGVETSRFGDNINFPAIFTVHPALWRQMFWPWSLCGFGRLCPL